MELSPWLGFAAIMLMLLVVFLAIQKLTEQVRELKRQVILIDATRQSRVKGSTATRAAPHVDARGTTKQRYPAERRGARMSMAVKREPSNARESADD